MSAFSARRRQSISVQPVVTAGAYSANDAVGGLMEFAEAVAGQGRSGTIQTLLIIDQAEQSVEYDLVLFDRTFTATADNAALAISAADSLNCIGTINVPTSPKDIGAASVATVKDIQIGFKVNGGKSIFGQLVTRGTPTYGATSDIQVKLIVEQD